MKQQERLIIGGLVALMLVLWLGFLVHRSPRFPGSTWGGALGVSGAALMLVPLAYSVVKRIRPLKRLVTRRVSMATLLKWHICAGVVGPILEVAFGACAGAPTPVVSDFVCTLEQAYAPDGVTKLPTAACTIGVENIGP